MNCNTRLMMEVQRTDITNTFFEGEISSNNSWLHHFNLKYFDLKIFLKLLWCLQHFVAYDLKTGRGNRI